MKTTNLPPQAYTKDILSQAFLWLKDQPENIKSKATTTDAMVSYYLRDKRAGLAKIGSPSADAFKDDLKSLSVGFDEFESLNQPSKSNIGQTSEKDLNEFESVFVDPVIDRQEERERENEIKLKVKQAVSTQNHNNMPAPPQAKRSVVSPKTVTMNAITPILGPSPMPAAHSQPSTTADTYSQPAAHNQSAAHIHTQASANVQTQPATAAHTTAQPAASQTTQVSQTSANIKTNMMIEDTLNNLNLSSKDEAIRVLVGLGYGHIKRSFPKK